jgi:hypothetical protein
MENLAAGVAVALALGAAEGRAAPYSMVSDGADQVWVLNGRSGEVSLCRSYAAPGPKVVDVLNGQGQAREAAPRTPATVCETAYRPARGSATPRQNYTGYTMYAPMSGLSTAAYAGGGVPGGPLGLGFPYTFARPSLYGGGYGSLPGAKVVLIRPETVNIDAY